MMFAGLCDMFDGTVARKFKRSESAKKFGIQIDSLCDMVCFGITPSVIGVLLYCGSKYRIIAFITGFLLVLCGVIRLAFFNVTEEERQQSTSERRKYYQGLPITSSAITAPLAYVIGKLISRKVLPFVYSAFLVLNAFLFIYNFKMPKPHGKANAGIIVFALGLFACVLIV